MLLQIGYAKSGIEIESLDNRAILANGIRVARLDGWMQLESSAREILCGAPEEFAVRLAVTADPEGVAFLVAEQIEIGGRRYEDLAALALAMHGDIEWLGHLVGAVHREIQNAHVLSLHLGRVVPRTIAIAAAADDTRKLRAARA